MSAWRRRALELFPQLCEELHRRDYSIYMLYFDLLPMVRDAHDAADADLARRIYGFAEWCFEQTAKDLWNAAGVAFYEHLFDEKRYWRHVIPWLSPRVLKGCWTLWEARLTAEELAELRKLIENRRDHFYRQAGLPDYRR
jgi:hypothetical protein